MAEDERHQFERLFNEHYDAVLAFALVRAGAEMAKDAAAQAFLVAWRRRRELPEHVLPWLLGVTRKTLADQRRAAARRDSLATRLQEASAGDRIGADGDPAEQIVDAHGVVAAFLTLGERDREVLRLVAWDRLSPADAARVLGCSKAAFAVRLSRARRRLSAALAREDEAEPATAVELTPQPLEAP